MADIPQEALALLQTQPNTWKQFKQTFGTLPEGFKPPDAPPEAVEYLKSNPTSAAQFEDTFGYNPTTAAQPAAAAQPDALNLSGDGEQNRSLGTAALEGTEDVGKMTMRSLAGLGHSMQWLARNLVNYGLPGATQTRAATGQNLLPDELPTERAAREATTSWLDAMQPETRASIQKQFVERADDGALQFGEGATDPMWWVNQAIDMGVNMAPGIGTAGKAARVAYGARYAQALAKAGAEKASVKIAQRYAEREGVKAAQRAAMLAGTSSESLIAGGQAGTDVARVIDELDEPTMQNYEPYRHLRENGMSHEAAKHAIADDQGIKAAIATAAVTGLSGAPLFHFIGSWASKATGTTLKNRAGAAAAGIAGEGAQEFVQEGGQQLATNLATNPVTGKTDSWEGVLESAITGAAVGGALGGGLGAAAGPEAATQPKTTQSRILEKKMETFRAAQANLEAARYVAGRPTVKVDATDIADKKAEYGTALADLSGELLKSGKLDKETQTKVADALQEARAMGIEIPEVADGNQQGKLSEADATGVAPGGGAGDKASVKAAATGAGPAPTQLTETETARLAQLNKLANGETLPDAELHQLVAEKQVRISKEGQPVLQPAGRRLRKKLGDMETAAAVHGAQSTSASTTSNVKKPRTLADKKRVLDIKAETPKVKLKVAKETPQVEANRAKRATKAAAAEAEALKTRERDAPLQADREAALAAEKDVALQAAPLNKKVETSVGQAMQEAILSRNMRQIRQNKKPAAEVTTNELTEAASITPPSTPAERKLDIEDGFAFRKPSGTIKFRHFSNLKDDSVTLDPEFKGTGLPGRERDRGGPKTVDLYAADMPDSEVERGLAGKTEYEVEVQSDDLYDIDADPIGLKAQAKDRTGRIDPAVYTQAIQDAGYQGFLKTAEPYAGQARLFQKTAAKKRVREEEAEPAFSKPQQDTPEFKKWFGKSKVVNEDGSPKVVYHGTQRAFDAFDQDEQNANSTVSASDMGFFFTSDKAEANAYAQHDFGKPGEKAPNVVPAYLSLKNPLMVDISNEHHAGEAPGRWYDDYGQKMAQYAKDSGYDGLIIQDESLPLKQRKQVLYVAFDPTQIKSSVGNFGDFDPTQADFAARVGTGKGSMTTTQLQDALGEISGYLGYGVKVVEKGADLPVPPSMLETVKNAEGLFVKSAFGGDVYLVRENVRDAAHARQIATHEIVGHYGLRGLLGSNYEAMMDRVWNKFTTAAKAAAVRNDIDIAGAKTTTQADSRRRLAAEEVIAYASERVLKDDIDAKDSIYHRIMRTVRNWLREIGVMQQMDASAVRDLIYASRDFVRSAEARKQRELADYHANLGKTLVNGVTQLDKNQPLAGMPTSINVDGRQIEAGPFEPARQAARDYMNDAGLPYQPVTNYAKVDKARAKRIAAAFDQMKHDPLNPRVKSAYDAMIRETVAQWHAIAKTGLKVEFIEPGQDDPYAASPRLSTQDVVDNNHLWVFPTTSGFGSGADYSANNPMLAKTDVKIGGRTLLANDVFRIVHDYFGHVKEGVGFRADGEENAWRSHASMYSPLARLAMTSETRGQNSWVNFGPQGEQNQRASGEKTVYADQKIGLLPDEFANPDADTELESPWAVQRRNTVTESPAFKAWFGASKIRTETGAPKVLYHGTKKAFERFGEDGRGDGLVFMTDEPGLASEYAGTNKDLTAYNYKEFSASYLASRTQELLDKGASPAYVNEYITGLQRSNMFARERNVSPNVMPVYAKMEKPAVVKAPKGFRSQNGRPVSWDNIPLKFLPEDMQAQLRGYPHSISTNRISHMAQEMGYDGVVFHNIEDGIGNWETATNIYVAFRSQNLKSAVGNNGDFDPTQADIALRKGSANEEARATVARIAKHMTPDELSKLNRATAQKVIDLFDQLPDDAEMAATALAGKAKRGWYRESAKALVNVFGHDSPRFAGLLAALSPQTSVEMNLRNALAVWKGWIEAGRPTTRDGIFKVMADNVVGSKQGESVLPAWINNTVRVLQSETPDTVTLSGPKVHSFAANLRGETDAVTLDTWMANFAKVEQKLFAGTGFNESKGDPGKGPGYMAYSARVRQAAKRLSKMTGENWTPSEVQETIWSWTKALYEESEAMGSMATAKDIVENKELTDALINATPDFHTLFQQEEHRRVLIEAGYADQLDGLESSAFGSSEGEAGEAVEPDQRKLISAAKRLDALRVDRAAAKAATVAANNDGAADYAFSMKNVPTGGNADLESFLGKIGAKPVPLKQRFKELTDGIFDRMTVALQDHFYGIRRAEDIAGIAIGDGGYMSARMSTGASSLMRATLEQGYPEWDSANLQERAPRVGGNKGFFDIIQPLGNEVNTWLAWMVARRADRLMGEGRENLFTPAEIAAARALGDNNPLFQQVAREYAQFKGKILDFAQDAGIIDPTTRPLWDHADHIPFYRLMENGAMKVGGAGGGLGFVKNQIKKLKGGEQNLGDPLENMMKNWSNLIEASVRAHAAKLTVDNLDGTGLVVKIPSHGNITITQADAASFLANNPKLVKDLQSIGLNPVATDPATLAAIQQMFGTKAPEGDDVISIWDGGKREHYRVNDDLLFRSLQSINPTVWGSWMNIFRMPKRLLTATITIVPEFGIKNFWRDMWGVFVQGKNDGSAMPIIPIYDSVRGAVKYAMKSGSSKDLMAGGASFEGTGSNEVSAAQAARRSAIVHGGSAVSLGKKLINTPAKAFLMYQELMASGENAHRIAVYDRTLAQGGTRKSALFEAKDLMDFSMRGNSAVARFLVESVPFLGARVAGLTTLGRRIRQNPAGVFLRGMLIVAASASLLAMNYDDDRYKQLTLDQKNLYWHIFVGDAHYRIPKPFEVGTIFGTIPEAIGDALFTNADEPDKFKQSAQMVSHAFTQALDLSPKVGAVWPIVELAMNKNTFTGAPILNMSDQGKLPEDQDGPQVSPTYRAVARAMPEMAPDILRSPKTLQHLGKAYIGTLQDYVLAVTDKLARAEMGEAPPPAKDSGETLFVKTFVDRGPARSTKYLNTMYLVADEAEKVHRSLEARMAGNDAAVARGEQLMTDKEDQLFGRKAFSDAIEKVSDIRKGQRALQLDPDLTPEDKKAQIDELQEAANSVAASVWDYRPGGKMSPSVAAKLMGTTKNEQVRTLQQAGMPATADLINSLTEAP